jgi:uncharacterized protein
VLFPIQFVSALASRPVLSAVLSQWRMEVAILAAISLVGGTVGALLLLFVPPTIFAQLAPWLLLIATLFFGWGAFFSGVQRPFVAALPVCRGLHFLVAVYGGFFGGGIGILVLAVLSLYGMQDIRAMNSLKVVLSGLIGLTATLIFSFSGIVHWRETLVMMGAAALGGYSGTRFGMSIPRRYVECLVVVVGLGLATWLFATAKPA